LPFCHLSLKAHRPLPPAYPKSLKTFGDHLRKRRLDLKLFQKDVAQRLGVDETTIHNWETGHTTLSLPIIPRLIAFLGYIPFETLAKSLCEKIVIYRRILGLSQKELARQLGIDPSTLGRWEREKGQPSKQLSSKLEAILLNLPHPPKRLNND